MKRITSVLFITVLVLLCTSCVEPYTQNAPASRVIPYPEGYDITTGGASAYGGIGDHADSP